MQNLSTSRSERYCEITSSDYPGKEAKRIEVSEASASPISSHSSRHSPFSLSAGLLLQKVKAGIELHYRIYVALWYKYQAMQAPDLDNQTIERIIEMAWEDRPPFETIEAQFGLQEKQVIAVMRRPMSVSSFKMWRKQVSGRKTKHLRRRDFNTAWFKPKNQKD